MSFWKPEEGLVIDNQNMWQMSAWLDYYLLTGDERTRAAIRDWADVRYKVWSSDDRHFKAGYWKSQDVDHGNEDIGYTVGRWWLLEPGDKKLTYLVESTATLAGNWSKEDVPDWYDWEKHRWKAYHLGSEHIGEITHNTKQNDHRLVQIALLAAAATGDQRDLTLAKDYLDGYIQRLNQLGPEEPHQKYYLQGFSYNHEDPPLGRYFNRIRYHFMESMANPLLDLYRMVGERKYLVAARKVLEPSLPDSLYTWMSNKESSALANYRYLSGDHFMDEAVMEWVDKTCDYPDDLFQYFWRPLAYQDAKWDWFHMHWVRTHPAPNTYGLAYQITGDQRYLNWMLEGAIERAQMIYAQQSRPETRYESLHPEGPWNDWDWRVYILAFEVADILFPMTGRHYAPGGEYSNAVCLYDVRFFRQDGSVGIPDTVAVNYRATRSDRRLVELYNAADHSQTILVEPQDFLYTKVAGAQITGGAMVRAEKDVKVTLPPHTMVKLDIALAR